MRQALGCAVVLALVVGCGKAKPPRTSALSAPGPSAPTTPAGSDKPDYLANVLKPKGTFNVPADPGALNPIFLTRDGTRLAIGLDRTRTTQVWDVSGAPKKLYDLPGTILAYSPDGKRYLRAGTTGPEVADAETGAAVSTLEAGGFQFHFRSAASILNVAPANPVPDKPKELVVREFDPATGKVTVSFNIPTDASPSAVAFGLNGGDELAVANAYTRKAEFWSLTTKQRMREITLGDNPKEGSLWELAVAPDGRWLTVHSASDIYDGRTGASAGSGPKGLIFHRLVPGRDLVAAKVGFNDEKLAAHMGYAVYDFLHKETRAFLPADGTRIAFSGDGKVAATYSGEVKVWDLSQVP